MRRRIAVTRWPTKELVPDRSQGVQLATLQELARYWTSEYDCRRCEARLNAVMAFMESVPDFAEAENLHDFSIHAFADDPNELVAEYRSDMKLTNGREYRNTYVVRATVKDGKLIRFRDHFDSIPLLIAIGGSVTLPAEG